MKIGVIGLGSIGKRHIRCLAKLGYKDIIALRTKKGTAKTLPEDLKYIKEVFSPDDFYSYKLDGIIISNPTSLHIDAMKMPLKKRIPVFVEKPLAESYKQIKEINDYGTSQIMVGYNLRHNQIINFVKNFIDSGSLGKIYKAYLYCGQYLPLWHPYADYKTEYYAKKKLGGGVLRTLSHEIDLAFYFFKDIKRVAALVEKISDLKIDVDDNAMLILKADNNVSAVIELDYLNPVSTKKGIIFGSKGTLKYSFSKSSVTLTEYGKKEKAIYKNPSLDWNDMYINQMKAFTSFIKNKKKHQSTYKDALKVMKAIKAAEESMKNKSWANI